ncbi:MAG: phosphotransferase [Thermosynechococcaceae cyanobacterium MS004]|nr:phosphotransferase [Thermosynechococcaceae cyanobacterium MS004]
MLTQVSFPVSYSTLDCAALRRQLLPMFRIGPVVRCEFWNRGLSDIYLVETLSAKYVLRISHAHWRSKADIDFEVELLDYLRQRGMPVAVPLRTRNGELSVEIFAPEGLRYASLFTYAQGRVPVGDLSLEQSKKLGETIAKMHRTAKDFQCAAQRQPLSLEYLLDESLGVIEPHLRFRSEDLAYLRRLVADIKDSLADLPKTFPHWVICWGDPHSGNVHFTEDDQLTLFDFDQCGYGWRAFEVAKFLQISMRTGIARKVRDAFLDAYQSILPLTQQEIESLQPFTQTAHIWSWSISLEAAKVHSGSRLDEKFFISRLQQLKMFQTAQWQLF